MKRKMFIMYNIIVVGLLIVTGVTVTKYIQLSKNANSLAIQSYNDKIQLNRTKNEMNAYKMLYNSQENSIKEYKALYKKSQSDLESLKSEIYISKEKEKKVSRGDYVYKDLSQYEIMTVSEMNKWIAERAPENSPFIGRGDVFLKAASEEKMDPKFIVAVAGIESGWGTSPLAKYKGNYFSIMAYNDDPYNSAKSFNGGIESNILNGVNWIKTNFYDRGKTSIYKIQYSEADKAYCQNNDGSPNLNWEDMICNIVYK